MTRRKAGSASHGSAPTSHDELTTSRTAVPDSAQKAGINARKPATPRDPATSREGSAAVEARGATEPSARERGTSGPALLTIVRRALDGECKLDPGTAILIAVSGGPDSMALLSCLIRLAPERALLLRAHGVDHGLRPEAAAELDLAERFATEHNVPFARTELRVTRGGNLQARARDARWTALRDAASGAVIATAHHAEDRAETVLMRILRGSGARGLAVLPPRGPGVIRPLLRALRSDVMAHIERHRVPFATDPSNTDAKYLRARIRADVLPLLRALDPAIVSHLSAIADDLEGAATARQLSERTSWTAALPRPTQEAIAELVRSRSREARVWLPNGLVIMNEPKRTRKAE